MKRLSAMGTVLVLALSTLAGSALGASPFGKYLPPDQAFQLKASAAPDAIYLNWQIADGYYLYRDRFKFAAGSGAIGQAQFPPGKVKNDPNFGRVEVYRHALQVRLPVTSAPANGKVELAVTYQGCADAGLCYAPITKHLSVAIPAKKAAAGALSAAGSGGPGGGATTVVNEQSHLADLVTHANPAWFVLVFFGLGVLLAFTPCVLPMVPILAGVLGGERGMGTRRGFFLSSIYVLAMAAVYTAAGVAAGFAGTGLQGFFQAPWVIALFVAIFVALSLSMFGLYELRLPASVTQRVSALSGRQGGGWLGAAVMGALAALIVSPCVAAPLAGALIAIGQMGEPTRGGLALAALALGMGAPLVVYGTVAGRLLPRAGRWMTIIERLLGIILLAYAVWLLGRIVPAPVTLVLWGGVGLLAAFFLGLFNRPWLARSGSLARGAGAVAGVCGTVLIVGGLAGGTSPLAPFAGLHGASRAEATALDYRPVASLDALKAELASASRIGQPVMVDFYADWCTSCLEMEHKTLSTVAVRNALGGFRVLRVDVTENTRDDRALLHYFGLYGPPAYLFYDRQGQRLKKASVVGFMDTEPFLERLELALNAS
ncbi:MAG: protein-disulfide reductase DsbD [Gammaproteobacteria bacterium]|nr:protein-disulfide reductase DsbD [Gammaproteobacteria bacterium]